MKCWWNQPQITTLTLPGVRGLSRSVIPNRGVLKRTGVRGATKYLIYFLFCVLLLRVLQFVIFCRVRVLNFFLSQCLKKDFDKHWSRSGVAKVRPAGRIRPSNLFHLKETLQKSNQCKKFQKNVWFFSQLA